MLVLCFADIEILRKAAEPLQVEARNLLRLGTVASPGEEYAGIFECTKRPISVSSDNVFNSTGVEGGPNTGRQVLRVIFKVFFQTPCSRQMH